MVGRRACEGHAGVQRWCATSTACIAAEPALHELDFSPRGLRVGRGRRRGAKRLRVPAQGRATARRCWWCATSRRCRGTTTAWACRTAARGANAQQRRRATTAAPAGATWARVEAAPVPRARPRHSLCLTLPPLSTLILEPSRAPCRQDRASRARMPRADAATAPAGDPPPLPHGRVRAVIDAVLPTSTAAASPSSASRASRVESRRTASPTATTCCASCCAWWREGEADRARDCRWSCAATTSGGRVHAAAPGRYYYTVVAWVDAFDSWRHELARRVDPDDIRIAAHGSARSRSPRPPSAPAATTARRSRSGPDAATSRSGRRR